MHISIFIEIIELFILDNKNEQEILKESIEDFNKNDYELDIVDGDSERSEDEEGSNEEYDNVEL